MSVLHLLQLWLLNFWVTSSFIPLLLLFLCYSIYFMDRAHYLSSTPLTQPSVAGVIPTIERVRSCVQLVATKGTVVPVLSKW